MRPRRNCNGMLPVWLFARPEQRGELLLAGSAEVHDAAAGGGIARGPFQLGELRHDRSAKRPREMMAPLAPVQTSLAHRTAWMGQRIRWYLQRICEEARAVGGERDFLLSLPDQPLLPEAVEHLPCEVVG